MDYKQLLANGLNNSGDKKQEKKPTPKKETLPSSSLSVPRQRNKKPPVDAPNGEYEKTLPEQKTEEEVRKLKIANEKELKNLFLMELFNSIMGELSHSVQTNFVDIPRREAAKLSAKWCVPEIERDIEKDLSDIIEAGINAFCKDIENLMDEGVFD